MNDCSPNAIIVKLLFDKYHSKSTGKSIPNDIRRWLMGLRKSPIRPFNSAVAEKMGKPKENLVPYCFCLIKDPMLARKSGSKNAAIGAIVMYLYSGTPHESEAVCRAIRETLNSSKRVKSIAFSDYEVFVAKNVTYEKGVGP